MAAYLHSLLMTAHFNPVVSWVIVLVWLRLIVGGGRRRRVSRYDRGDWAIQRDWDIRRVEPSRPFLDPPAAKTLLFVPESLTPVGAVRTGWGMPEPSDGLADPDQPCAHDQGVAPVTSKGVLLRYTCGNWRCEAVWPPSQEFPAGTPILDGDDLR